MLRIGIRFPLGVYHALSADSFEQAEWPPNPVRVVGALLAAAHQSDAVDLEAARNLLQRVCEADPPDIVAPECSPVAAGGADGRKIVAEIRGASRWAPRNHTASEIKQGISPRNVGRGRTEVYKGGVAIGELQIEMRWPETELSEAEVELLRLLLEEVTYIGTSRSPALLHLATEDSDPSMAATVWRATAEALDGVTEVRVPIPSLLPTFDDRHQHRSSTGKKPVEKAGHIPNTSIGASVPYLTDARRATARAAQPLDPRQWGSMIILELDDGAEGSEMRPRAAASYLVARAFREALLGAYGPRGSATEAPSILRGHGGEPHVAIVPLPFVGTIARDAAGPAGAPSEVHGDGLIRGIVVVMPHEDRVPDVARQQLDVEAGLQKFVIEPRRWIDVPGAGRLLLRLPPPGRPLLRTLRESRYRATASCWETVTPIVHARRRTSSGPRGAARQVAADCEHVGLPEPVVIEQLASAPLGGGPDRLLPDNAVPEAWRRSTQGPRAHLRISFDRPIVGPVILGRARHFGVGLCLPAKPRHGTAVELSPDREAQQ